ncbi:hypothetical protein FGL95_22660 [Nocardiaceae bacterium YC2-7]|uniref:ScoMcrA-like N-terminal head domain-containing protein n=1 Tax=Antrihabitans stalactiti TaxID=2584121 RepID=A0A848KLH8_9NOCA|nr:hypothetical protein [Antrihabitans stalactiti]
MQLSDVTRESVVKAIAEYDKLGREEFLERNGFGEARDYFLVFGSRRYDSKAIVGVAYRHATGESRRSGDFTGGKNVAKRLRDLCFEVDEGTSQSAKS